MTPCVGQGAPHGSCLANSRGVKKKLWVAAYVVLGSLVLLSHSAPMECRKEMCAVSFASPAIKPRWLRRAERVAGWVSVSVCNRLVRHETVAFE